MSPTFLRVAALACVLLVVAGLSSRADPPIAPPPRSIEDRIADLVRQLGSPDYDLREVATAKLSELDLDQPPHALMEVLTSPNPEVSRRARQAITAIRERANNRPPYLEPVYARKGKIDRFIANTATWELPGDNDALWQAALDVANNVVAKAQFEWPRLAGRSRMTNALFGVGTPGRLDIRTDQSYRLTDKVLPGGSIWPGAFRVADFTAPAVLYGSIVISDGQVLTHGFTENSVILSNGDVANRKWFQSSVVICDGDVTVTGHVAASIVIARGNIRIGGYVVDSHLIAGGTITIGDPKPPPLRHENVVKEHVRRPLDFVNFFELSDVGVEVERPGPMPFAGVLSQGIAPIGEVVWAKNGIPVQKVAAGQPFAVAGVREGDVITHVGDKPVNSAATLRRLVRDASATKGEAVLTVRRGDKPTVIRVAIPD